MGRFTKFTRDINELWMFARYFNEIASMGRRKKEC